MYSSQVRKVYLICVLALIMMSSTVLASKDVTLITGKLVATYMDLGTGEKLKIKLASTFTTALAKDKVNVFNCWHDPDATAGLGSSDIAAVKGWYWSYKCAIGSGTCTTGDIDPVLKAGNYAYTGTGTVLKFTGSTGTTDLSAKAVASSVAVTDSGKAVAETYALTTDAEVTSSNIPAVGASATTYIACKELLDETVANTETKLAADTFQLTGNNAVTPVAIKIASTDVTASSTTSSAVSTAYSIAFLVMALIGSVMI